MTPEPPVFSGRLAHHQQTFLMRLFKPKYKDRKTGKHRLTTLWYIELRDSEGRPARMPVLASKAQSEEFGRKVEHLIASRVAGTPLDPQLINWLEALPQAMLRRLLKFDLIDPRFVGTVKPLADHLGDFEDSLKAKKNTGNYVALKVGRIRKILQGCRFSLFPDISASRLETFLAGLREGPKKTSIQTTNFYLQAFQQFCRWMHRDQRAGESPVVHLQALNAKLDPRHHRRPLTLEEFGWLLHATEHGPARGGVCGAERALLYRFAVETGFRANELASLRINSFMLASDPPLVRLNAIDSKRRCEDIQVVKQDTAELLKQHFAGKQPTDAAFKMPSKQARPKVMKRDLESARSTWLESLQDPEVVKEMIKSDFLVYKDSQGRFADFHSLRHATGSFLAAAGVSPKVAQAIMRHSDINLTMSLYSHSFREDEAKAVENLPDLSKRPTPKRQADST